MPVIMADRAAMQADGENGEHLADDQTKLAAGYWAKLAQLTREADTERWEMVQARHQIAAK